MDNSSYKVEKSNSNNIHFLVQLFKETRNIQFKTEYFKQKNEINFLPSYCSFFAVDTNGKPCAHCGSYASEVLINNKKVVALQIADVITHPNHQRKGLFAVLLNAAEEHAKSLNIPLLFAVPNEQSEPGFVRSLLWRADHKLNVYFWNVSTIPLLKMAHKLKLASLFRFFWVQPILSIFKYKNDLIGNDKNNRPLKSKEFITHKEFNNNFIVKYKGLIIYAKIEGVLTIGDLEDGLNKNAAEILKILNSFARPLGISEIRFEVSPLNYWNEIFNQIQTPQTGLTVVIKELINKETEIHLSITGGDIDVF